MTGNVYCGTFWMGAEKAMTFYANIKVWSSVFVNFLDAII
jgi:hypothetical protein